MAVPRARAAALLALATALARSGGAVEPPALVVEAPPELATAAARIRAVEPADLASAMELIGLRRPGPPIRVVLAPESSHQARNTPAWISGFAYGTSSLVVLFPERTPSYPDSSLEELLRHEVAHVLVSRAAGGREVPRWFNEGVAMIAGGSWNLSDRSRMSLALILDKSAPMEGIEKSFAGGRRRMASAYAVSEAFMREVLRLAGAGAVARILEGTRAGLDFEVAFRRATGWELPQAEKAFWNRYSFWYRWVPILTSSFTLWTAITALALLATVRRRQRDAALHKQWEEEERRSQQDASSAPEDETVH